MRWHLPIVLLFFLGSCNSGTPEAPPNRWADERLWPVLEAQEYRDTDALCALLKDDAAEVREAAALAFASVQDTLGIPCLLAALRDDVVAVRATAVFALGFVADSLTIERMAELAMNESDATVQRAYLSTSFLAMQRKGMLKDPNAILYYLESSEGHERVRAADALRRLPDSVLVGMEEDYLRLVKEEQDVEVKAMLVRGMKVFRSEGATDFLRTQLISNEEIIRLEGVAAINAETFKQLRADLLSRSTDSIGVRIVAARTWANFMDHSDVPEVERRYKAMPLDIPVAMELFRGGLSADPDPHFFRTMMIGLDKGLDNPFEKALVMTVHRYDEPLFPWVREFVSLVRVEEFPFLRTQALEALVAWAPRIGETRSKELLEEVIAFALGSGDVAMLAMVAEAIEKAPNEWPWSAVGTDQLRVVSQGLILPRDFEAWSALESAIAKRDGLAPPPHTPPPLNHPIEPAKLRALPQGQRYRITTAKGEIIIATDVNETPGSSLAFDSLVTAGYYNGKAFHRMVPNFVVQGGCPRGDGYGGMDWTLRTEIGRKLFTAGSVGLASAGRDTESCQFFITHSATPHLDGRYTRFGEVVEGMDVVWRLQVGDVMERVERMP